MTATEGRSLISLGQIFSQSRAALDLADKREVFEGKEDYEATCVRLRKRLQSRPPVREADRFLQLMRDRGGGNVALAWRRYFDSDGDGNLDFREFCEALIELKYKGDVPALWTELGGAHSNSLTLEALDPENATVLDYFGDWCASTMGGPLEVFKEIDADGSYSLTADELVEGMQSLGFFGLPDRPAGLETEADVLDRLFPLLDQNGHGCITPSQLLFLEKDVEKKQVLERQLARIAKLGVQAAPEPLPNDAQRMLHHLAMSTTMLGGKWKNTKVTNSDDYFGLQRRPKRSSSSRGHRSSASSFASVSNPTSPVVTTRDISLSRSPKGCSTTALPHIGTDPQLAQRPVSTLQESPSRARHSQPQGLPALL